MNFCTRFSGPFSPNHCSPGAAIWLWADLACFVFQLRNNFSLFSFFLNFFKLKILIVLHKHQRIMFFNSRSTNYNDGFHVYMKFPLFASQLQFHVSKHVAVFPMVFDKTVEGFFFLFSLKNYFLAWIGALSFSCASCECVLDQCKLKLTLGLTQRETNSSTPIKAECL